MAISNVSVNSLVNSTSSSSVSKVNANATNVGKTEDVGKTKVSQQPSATVTISAQGQRLSQAQTQIQTKSTQVSSSQVNVPQTNSSQASNIQAKSNAEATNTLNAANTNANALSPSKEAASTPGIQFIAGEKKSGRVNTYA